MNRESPQLYAVQELINALQERGYRSTLGQERTFWLRSGGAESQLLVKDSKLPLLHIPAPISFVQHTSTEIVGGSLPKELRQAGAYAMWYRVPPLSTFAIIYHFNSEGTATIDHIHFHYGSRLRLNTFRKRLSELVGPDDADFLATI